MSPNMTPLRHLLTAIALVVLSTFTWAQPNVEVGLQSSAPNELQVNLLPDAAFDQVVGWAVVTVKYPTNAEVSLGAPAMVQANWPAALSFSVIDQGTLTNGGYTYRTYYFDNPFLEYVTAPYNWTADNEVPFFTIPVTNTSGACVSFELTDDAFQAAQNIQWAISLNGQEKQDGYIGGGSSTAQGFPVWNVTDNLGFCTIQAAINAGTTGAGDVIQVNAGTYTENVNVNKGVTIRNVATPSPRPVVTANTGTEVFLVSAPGVTIDSLEILINQGPVTSGIRTSASGSYTGLTVTDCLISGTGTTGSPVFNSWGILMGTFGGVLFDEVTLTNNTIGHTGTSPLGRAVRTYNVHGTWSGNDLSAWYSMQVGDVAGGLLVAEDNTLTGVAEINNLAHAGDHRFENNALYPSNAYGPGTDFAQVELKNLSIAGAYLSIKDNTFNDYTNFGIFSGRANNVTVEGNTFNPLATATDYRSVRIDTKQRTTAVQPAFAVGMSLLNNIFNGNGLSGGIALELANSDNVSSFGSVSLSGNSFVGNNGRYISLNNGTGSTVGDPIWTGMYASTKAQVTLDLDATDNTFNGVVATSMDLAQHFAAEDRIQHGIDDGALGLVRVKADEVFVTQNSFVAPASTSAHVQRGIDKAIAGDVVNVASGTYANSIVANKGVMLLGANSGVSCGSRGAESIIAPASGLPVNITADGVTIDGFEITAPGHQYAILGNSRSNLAIRFNHIHHINSSGTPVLTSTHAIQYTVGNSPMAATNVNVSDNCFNNIASSALTNWSASAIGFLQSTTTGTLTGLSIERNTISTVHVNNAAWPTGKIAYGIQLNAGGGSGYMSSTGKIVDAMIADNEISDLSGHIATAIGLEGNTEDASVTGNKVWDMSSTKNAARAGGGVDLNALKFENNRFVGTVTVANNSFDGSTFTSALGAGVGYGVANYVPEANGGTANVSCNWFGTAAAHLIEDNAGLTGRILNKAGAVTNFSPYLVDGTDSSTDVGFQPPSPSVCTGEPVVITVANITDATCFENADGSVYTTVTGGTAPYTFVWAGGPSDPGNVQDAIGVLAIGTYTITVTDDNGSSASVNAVVGNGDVTPPTITCIGNQTVATDIDECYASGHAFAPASQNDNCNWPADHLTWVLSGATTGSGIGNVASVQFNAGTTTVTYTVTDAVGLTASCAFNVTMIDNQSPTVQCPADVTVETDASACTATLNTVLYPNVNDNCSPTFTTEYVLTGTTTGTGTFSWPYTNDLVGNSIVFNTGVTTVTYTVEDLTGNETVCSFTVTVDDLREPEVDCVSALTVDTDPGVCTTTLSWATLEPTLVADPCDVLTYEARDALNNVIVGGTAPFTTITFPIGINTLTFTLTEGTLPGRDDECTMTITVEDNELPVIALVGAAVVDLCQGQPYSDAGATAADNCDGNITANIVTVNPVDVNIPGTYIVTYNVQDAAGNDAVEVTRTVNVQPKPATEGTVTSTNSYNQLMVSGGSYAHTTCHGEEVTTSVPTLTSTLANACGDLRIQTEYNSTLPNIPSATVDLSYAQAQLAGPQTISPQNMTGAVQTITFISIPYYDADGSGDLSAGDIEGDPTIFVLTVQPRPSIEGTVTSTNSFNQTMVSGGSYAHTTCHGEEVTTSVPTLTSTLANACGVLRVETEYISTLPNIPSATVDLSYVQAQMAGPQTISPQNMTGAVQTITFISTPYYDVDGSGSLTAGDVLGQPTTFVLTVEPMPIIEGTVTSTNSFNQTMVSGGNYAHTTCHGEEVTTSVPTLTSTLANACGVLRVETQYISTLPNIPSATVDLSYAQAQLAGPQTISPQNMTGAVQTITFISTPYYDVDGSGSLTAGDVLGEPTTFVLTVEPRPIVSNQVTTLAGYDETMVSGSSHAHTICSGEEITTTPPSLLSDLATACGVLRIETQYISTLPNITSQTVDEAYSLLSMLPPTTISPTNITGSDQTITFISLPYHDVDGSGSLTAGDVQGEPTTFVLTVRSELTLSCPADITVDSEPGICEATVSFAAISGGTPAPTVEYSIGGSPITSPYTFPLGTTTVDVSTTNACGTLTCSFTVIVEDNQAPVAGCVGDQNVVSDAGMCTYTHSGTGWNATATDNCSVASIAYVLSGVTTGSGTNLNGVVFNLGTTNVTWTATDGSGNTHVCSFDVIVTDDQDPVATCVIDQNVVSDAGVCIYTHSGTAWDATATDNCSVASIAYVLSGVTTGSGASLDAVVFNLGTTTVTWTTTDGSGNIHVCSFDVNVTDDQDPVATCVIDQNVVSDAGVCTYTHSGTALNATATDNCSVASIGYVLSGVTTGSGTSLDGVVFNLGVTNVTWTATDGSGNTDICSFDVTVADDEDPVITCVADQTVDTDAGDCTYAHNGTGWDATATDNCSVASIEYVLTGVTTGSGTSLDGVVFNLGVTNVTYTATDAALNTLSQSFTVTVADAEVPTIVAMPANISVDNDPGDCGALVSWTEPNSADNCTGHSIAQTAGPANGGFFPVGITTVTYTATDAALNTLSQSFTVTVADDEVPVWSVCPGNISVVNDLGDCSGGTIFWAAPTVSDNCDANPNVVLPTWSTGDFFPIGTTTVTYTAQDNSGNIGTCSFDVEVYIIDTDGDGVCDEDDCDPLDPNLTFPGAACDDGDPSTLNDTVTIDCTCEGTPYLDLSVKALLDGPYVDPTPLLANGDGQMTDNLNDLGLVPTAHPYNVAPFNYAGSETVAPAVFAVTGPNAIVDWVLLELRDKVNPAVIVARRAALVQRDGDIVDLDGTSPVRFLNLMANDYHVAVRHRNHVGAMSATPLALSYLPNTVDFTSTSFANYGTTPANALNAQRTRDGRRLLWSGNVLHDNVVKYAGSGNDRDPILVAIGGLVPTNVVIGVYDRTDVNMDGTIKYAGSGNDRDPILVNLNSNVLGQLFQQLP